MSKQHEVPDRPWAELLREAQRGNLAAFAQFVQASQRPLYCRCHAIVGDATLADDALQEAYMDIWRMLPRYQPERGGAILFVIADNAARRVLRRNRRRHEPLDDRAACAGPAVTEGLERHERHERVRCAIDALSPKLREVIRLRILCGMTLAEAAAALGIPPGTVGSREFQARKKLHDLLGDDRPAGQG